VAKKEWGSCAGDESQAAKAEPTKVNRRLLAAAKAKPVENLKKARVTKAAKAKAAAR